MRNCSFHGTCNNYTKNCDCDRYWMPNLFVYALTGSRMDCSWSTLYFTITVFMVMCISITCVVQRRICTVARKRLPYWTRKTGRTIRRRRRKTQRNGDVSLKKGGSSEIAKGTGQSSTYSLLLASDSLSSEDEEDDVLFARNTEKSSVDEIALRERFSSALNAELT
ncbi:hypothetical protein AB6A40_010415 [Gnathostoma spinigerum]|uniref:EGF-like domain-containing protein n=1 Tax=Gnathostoma spinigerum TaxID=75299 RepID=A0ABD6EV04_9BILA